MKKTSFLTLIVIILLLITATVLEKLYGTPWVATNIYGTTWFLIAWAVLAISATIYIFQRRLYRRPLTLLLHLSFLVILIGATITHYFGTQGQIHLRLGEAPTNTFTDTNYQTRTLPFQVALTDFQLIHYPGTTNPQDYISTIEITDNKVQSTDNREHITDNSEHTSDKSDRPTSLTSPTSPTTPTNNCELCIEHCALNTASVSMNKIAKHQGYRFYQSSYDTDLQGSILSVYHDPYGITTTYIGYFLLFISMTLLLFKKEK